MKDYLETFYKSILSGIYILIAAIIYLIVANEVSKLLGSMLFSLALLVIVSNNYNLYTGKIGYLFPYKKNNLINILIIIFGNALAIIILGFLINLANVNNLSNYANLVTQTKFNKLWYESLILAIFCGFLMYTAVDTYSSSFNDVSKSFIVIFAVMAFIMANFEHSIANIAYVVLSKNISFKIIGYLVLMVIGNGIGAIVLNLLKTKTNNNSNIE